MKILIIGGSGFIGSHLAEELANKGHSVFISSRKASRARTQRGKKYNYIEWDTQDPEQLRPHLEEMDAVVNLAGENIGAIRWWTKDRKRRLKASRLETGRALAKAFQTTENKPTVLVQASAIGYYGIHADTPDGESRKKGEGFLADLTQQWEDTVKGLEKTPVRLVYIRTGVVLAKNESFLAKLELSFKFGMGVIPGGQQWISWIHIKDEIQAIRFLIENPKAKGVYNLTAPEPVTMRELVRTIGKIRRLPAWITIPPFLIRLVLGEMGRETILASQDALPEALLDAGYSFQFKDIEDALANLSRR
jgi:uncharacterized protein (TIGR01777 family)